MANKIKNNNDFWKNRRIFPSITTTPDSDWKEKIEEVIRLGLKEVSLFLTFLRKSERKELYKLLERTKIEKIPLVHLRSDMDLKELDYLKENYKTEVFNTHTERRYPFLYNIDKYRDIIYIENSSLPLDEKEIKNFAGVCLDMAHLENKRLLDREMYKKEVEVIEKYPCGCNHISCIKKTPFKDKDKLKYDSHLLEDLSEFDYLKRMSTEYFSPLLNIELVNSIEEQLKARDYIIGLLENK